MKKGRQSLESDTVNGRSVQPHRTKDPRIVPSASKRAPSSGKRAPSSVAGGEGERGKGWEG
eukprot:scaffold15305_cov126-Cylindrotheca_fusiformis.AAC.14